MLVEPCETHSGPTWYPLRRPVHSSAHGGLLLSFDFQSHTKKHTVAAKATALPRQPSVIGRAEGFADEQPSRSEAAGPAIAEGYLEKKSDYFRCSPAEAADLRQPA